MKVLIERDQDMKNYSTNKSDAIKAILLALQNTPVEELVFDEGDLNLDLNDFAAPASNVSASVLSHEPSLTRSKKISVRIPRALLKALQIEAKRVGIGYQTLLVRTLKVESSRWLRCSIQTECNRCLA